MSIFGSLIAPMGSGITIDQLSNQAGQLITYNAQRQALIHYQMSQNGVSNQSYYVRVCAYCGTSQDKKICFNCGASK